MPRRAAVVDLGSLAVRLHIAEAQEPVQAGACGPFRTLHEERRIARLAQGLARGKNLSPGAQERAMEVLRGFQRAIGRFGVEREMTRVVATEALRKARDGPAFARRVEGETGIPTRILSPEEEARWTAHGALLSAPGLSRPLLIADPGGGSLEVIWVEAEGAEQQGPPPRWSSQPLGTLEVLRRASPGSPAGPEALARLEAELDREVGGVVRRLAPSGRGEKALWVTGGTALNMAAMLRRMSLERIRGLPPMAFSRKEVESLYRRLASCDWRTRRREPYLERGREDVIVPGLAVIRALLAASGAGFLTVTAFGLREGILSALLSGGGRQVG
ncbi:MAG: hypothetical protein ACE5IM_12205 [Nitrospinota bacterium]